LVQAWGFRGPPPGSAPDAASLSRLHAGASFESLEVNVASCQARLLSTTAAVDLGGIAKGYAVDLAARVLREADISSFQVDLGGNLCVGKPPRGKPAWRIGIKDPTAPSRVFAVLALSDEAVATSGGYERFVTVGGNRVSHVLDPRTGRPAARALSSTVVAPTAMTADALSTATHVLGPAASSRLLARYGARLLSVAGATATPRLAIDPALAPRVELAEFSKGWLR
ncbi:MAG: FAD:protein FMN transferase, partial [Candidatus Riflebacteria bacterium]|nr:FAD:protein FMN transferase [Candidatus Riflebacteria bacterium]